MRRILVDAARRKATARHGGTRRRVRLDELPQLAESPDGLLDLHDALSRFAGTEPLKAKLVELRFFAGLSVPEAAAALGVSPATAARWWEFARLWLFADLRGETEENLPPK
jgi:RNA polymerase sigma factor (TIGR02999 family)